MSMHVVMIIILGVSPLLGPLGAIGPPVIGPGLGLSPLDRALLGPTDLSTALTLGDSVTLGRGPLGAANMAATLGVDTSALRTSGAPSLPSDTSTTGSTQGILHR